jgi:hypothetical protein
MPRCVPAYDALYADYLDLYLDSRRVVHRLARRQATHEGGSP